MIYYIYFYNFLTKSLTPISSCMSSSPILFIDPSQKLTNVVLKKKLTNESIYIGDSISREIHPRSGNPHPKI